MSTKAVFSNLDRFLYADMTEKKLLIEKDFLKQNILEFTILQYIKFNYREFPPYLDFGTWKKSVIQNSG